MLAFLVVSCNDKIPDPPPYRDASTQFIIVDILDREGMTQMSSYQIEVIDANDLVKDNCSSSNNLKFWFCDTMGKYSLGQPIHFDKNR